MIYLDHHSTTPVDARVLERMWPFFREEFGNAASINHNFGRLAAEAVEVARQQIADLLGTTAKSIVFTSGATESNNLALKGVLRAARRGSHVVTTAVEHRAVLDPLKRMQRQGYGVTVVPVDSVGRVDPARVEAAILPETVLVSVMWANNEVGTLQPVREISDICRKRGVLFHTDAAQAVGKVPIDLGGTAIDLLSLSGHKLYAPKGIGALVVRQGDPVVRLEPLIDGGGQEGRLRSGTLPVPLIVGMGFACEIARSEMAVEQLRLAELSDRLRAGILSHLPDAVVNGPVGDHKSLADLRLAGNIHLSFPDVNGAALLANLTEIAASSGSACTSADPEPSHVLRALGVSEALSLSSLRFGLGRETTAEQIDIAAGHVVEVVQNLRALPK